MPPDPVASAAIVSSGSPVLSQSGGALGSSIVTPTGV